MLKLARYIEHEFDRNAIFFAQTHSRTMASLDFIDFILRDNNIVELNEEERRYVDKIRNCYINVSALSKEIAGEIQKYKETYEEFLLTEETD